VRVLLLPALVLCKHIFCNTLWLTIFVLLVVYVCACDMDNASVIFLLILLHYALHKEVLNGKRQYCLACWQLLNYVTSNLHKR